MFGPTTACSSARDSPVARDVRLLDGLGKRHETRGAGLVRTPATEAVGLVRDPTPVYRLAMHTVTLVVLHRRERRNDRDFVEARSTEARDLRVDVRMDAARQQRIVGEVDAGHHVCRAERHLLGLGEEIVRIAIEDHASHRSHRHEFLGHELRRVEHVEAGGPSCPRPCRTSRQTPARRGRCPWIRARPPRWKSARRRA